MNDETRQSSLRDGMAFLRRRRWIIIAATIVGVAAALGLSLSQSKTYAASASLRTHDPSQDFPAAGLQATQGEQPAQIAAQAAQTAERTAVLRAVRRRLSLTETIKGLQGDVSSLADPTSNLVHVTATAPTAEGAASLSNAAAVAVAAVTNGETRDRYARIASNLRHQAGELDRKLPPNFGSLSTTQQARYQNVLRQEQVLGEQAARLDALSAVSDPVQVTERANPPTTPTSPKPARDAVLGGIIGLLIGLLAAWGADSLDRRLRRPDEAQELVDLPLVGAITKGSLGGVPVGASPAEDHVASMDAFRMLRNNVRFLGGNQPPNSILVTSPLPEEGKTTVAIGVAVAAAASGLRTLLVEADLHRPVHAARLGLKPGPGIADYMRDDLKPADVLQVYEFVDPAVAHGLNGANGDAAESHLACITAGQLGGLSAEVIGSEAFAAFVGQVQRAYDLVVFDSAPLLAVAETLQIVPLVDAVVFCVRLGQTTTDQAAQGREALARLPERLTALVVTELPKDEGGYGYYSYAYRYRYGEQKTPVQS